MSKLFEAIGVFIIHALKGYEKHEKRVEKIFAEECLEYEFITRGDPTNMSEADFDKYFENSIKEKYSEGVISCTLNHFYAYEEIVRQDKSYGIIFENDPFFLKNFKEEMEKWRDEIEALPKGFIISLENSTLRFPSFWQTKSGVHFYQANKGRMAGAYLVDQSGARNMLEELKNRKCNDVIDWWHNGIIKRGIIRMYWAHPALVEQGSHNGEMNSTISTKRSNKWRKIGWKVQKMYKMGIRRLFNEEGLE